MSSRAPLDSLFAIEFGSKCSDLINTVWRGVRSCNLRQLYYREIKFDVMYLQFFTFLRGGNP